MSSQTRSTTYIDSVNRDRSPSLFEFFDAGLTNPDLVREYYRSCIETGLSLLVTVPVPTLIESGLVEDEWRKRAYHAVRLALEVSQDRTPVWGQLRSIQRGPERWSRDEYSKRQKIYEHAAAMIVEAGCTEILLTGFRTIIEARAAFNACRAEGSERPGLSFSLDRTDQESSKPGIQAECVGPACDPFGPRCILLEMPALDMVWLRQYRALAEQSRSPVGFSCADFTSVNSKTGEIARILKDTRLDYLGGPLAQFDQVRSCSALFEIKDTSPAFDSIRISSSQRVELIGGNNPVRIIGERINPTGRKKLAAKLKEKDWTYVERLVIEQEKAGAHLIDVNVGVAGLDEKVILPELIHHLDAVSASPLVIDSTDYQAMKWAGLMYNGRPLLNSTTAEEKRLMDMFEVARETGGAFVVMTIEHQGLPTDAQARLNIARRVLDLAERNGFGRQDILIDPLTLSAAVQPEQALETLAAMRQIKAELGLGLILGISNISFGLPARLKLNQSFLAMALAAGLDCAIIDPRIPELLDILRSSAVLTNRDPGALHFISVYARAEQPQELSAQVQPESDQQVSGPKQSIPPLDHIQAEVLAAIRKGDREQVSTLTSRLLEAGWTKQMVLDQALIPGIQKVGDLFEQGQLFLPHLMQAAECVQQSFRQLGLDQDDQVTHPETKAPILLATVKGDIHDLGKNLVATFLRSNGFRVNDLGKNVDKETLLSAVRQHKPELVGLSALMTTTMLEMEKTVRFLKEHEPGLKILVGGAVISPEFALKIGADGYAPNAAEAVNLVKTCLDSTHL
ncbi:cobalamin-dependent protein [bacterium]|nr:cobalamin-dependent protein [bacterium]